MYSLFKVISYSINEYEGLTVTILFANIVAPLPYFDKVMTCKNKSNDTSFLSLIQKRMSIILISRGHIHPIDVSDQSGYS